MNRENFDHILYQKQVPDALNPLLRALLFDAFSDWESAHDIAQSAEGTLLFDRLHAYLHRKEGDEWNANYWYRRAKTTMPNVSLSDEWDSLVTLFIE